MLAATLERGANARDYDALVLVAPPHFLGILKSTLDGEVARRVADTVGKDYANLSEHLMKQKLEEILLAA